MNKKILYLLAFLVKGWGVSLLLLLPFFEGLKIITLFQVGLLGMIFSVAQISNNFFVVKIEKKLGEKKIIILSLFLFLISWLLLPYFRNVTLLLLLYGLAGAGTGLFMPIANSLIAKSAKENLGQKFGDFAAFTDLGRVLLVPVTIFLLSFIGYQQTSIFFALISLISLGLFLLHSKEHFQTIKDGIEKINLPTILKNKKYLLSVITGVFDGFSSVSLFIFVPILLASKGMSLLEGGFYTTLFFVGYLFGRLLLGRFADKFGEVKVLIVAELLMAALIVTLIYVKLIVGIIAILFLLGAVTRGTSPVIRAMVANSVKDKNMFNKAYGFYSFSVNTSSVISRPVFGGLAGLFGISSVFYLAGLVAVLTIVPIIRYSKLNEKEQT